MFTTDVRTYQLASLLLPFSRNLKKEMKGEDIYVLICALMELKFLGQAQEVTEVFNENVENAVKWAQRRFGLNDDGIVGPVTKGALEGALRRARGIQRAELIFPLRQRPTLSYHSGGREVGAWRSPPPRLHAGCDLVGDPGTEVLAMADGTVIEEPYEFFQGTYALEVKHENGFIIRYTEVSRDSLEGMHVGKRINQGEVIARIGLSNCGSAMLHLEMYEGTQQGLLTQDIPPFMRRSDRLDPTLYLDNAPLWNEQSSSTGSQGKVSLTKVATVLTLRSQPSTVSSPMTTLSRGSTCTILEKVIGSAYEPDNRNDWLKVDYQGQQGFLAAYYIDQNGSSQHDRWTEALLRAPTSGASAATAVSDHLEGGVKASRQMAEADFQRVIELADRFCTAGAEFCVPTAILAALSSRESRCGNVLNSNGFGYDNCGFGIMQVDKRYHHLEGGDDPRCQEHIDQATRIFADYLRQIQLAHPDWDDGYLIKGAAVAYNSGVSNVQTKEGMDKGTTGNDYGSDVIARAQYYYELGIK